MLTANPYHNWISAEPPCNFEGAFYAFSDPGTDGIVGTEDDSLHSPPWNGTTHNNPYLNGQICFSGVTQLWPKAAPEVNYDLNWGAGIRFVLSQTRGESASKHPYSGSAKGFRIILEGSLKGRQEIRIGYTQDFGSQPLEAPFVPFTSLGEKDVWFEDVACPVWSTDCTVTGYGGSNPFELFIMVVGGDDAGDFDVCVTQLVPI